jgi:hypothetical protein
MLQWKIEYDASWKLVRMEILFLIWKKRKEISFLRVFISYTSQPSPLDLSAI